MKEANNSSPIESTIDFTRGNLQAGQWQPQCIAHRGFKALYAENTIAAFSGAVEGGANAIEMDVQVTRDEQIVMSHDGNLLRCYGEDKVIQDIDWAEVKQARTLAPPYERMPLLAEVLELCVTKEAWKRLWLVIDVKASNDLSVIQLLAKTLAQVHNTGWEKRLIVGIWHPKFLPLCRQYLSSISLAFIGASLLWAKEFMEEEQVGTINLFFPAVLSREGQELVQQVHARNKTFTTWTLNNTKWLEWAVRYGVDGIITDDPREFKALGDVATLDFKELGWWDWLDMRREYLVKLCYIYWFFWKKVW